MPIIYRSRIVLQGRETLQPEDACAVAGLSGRMIEEKPFLTSVWVGLEGLLHQEKDVHVMGLRRARDEGAEDHFELGRG